MTMAQVLATVRDSLRADVLPAVNQAQASYLTEQIARVLDQVILANRTAARLGPEQARQWTDLLRDLDARPSPGCAEPGFAWWVQAADSPAAQVSAAVADLRVLIADWADADQLAARFDAREGVGTVDFSRMIELLRASRETSPAVTGVTETASRPHDDNEVRSRLQHYLLAHGSGIVAEPGILDWVQMPSGKAKKTYRFRAVDRTGRTRDLICRMDFSSQTGTRAANEFGLLQLLFGKDVLVPEPFLAEADPAVLGGTFIIVQTLDGATNGGDPFPELNDFRLYGPEFGAQLAVELAKLHSVRDYHAVLPAAPAGALPTRISDFYRRWRGLPGRPPNWLATDLGFAWLLANPIADPRPQGIVHGDVSSANVLVRDGKLVSLIDWELAHIGDPAEDLGFSRLMFLEPLMPWQEFTSRYIEAGGPRAACELRVVNYLGLWTWVRSSVFAATLADYYASGQRGDLDCVSTFIDQGERCQDYILRELSLAVQLASERADVQEVYRA